MNYNSGQFVACVISVYFEVTELWNKTRVIGDVRNKMSLFFVLMNSEEVIERGKRLEEVIQDPAISHLKYRMETYYSNFIEALRNPCLTESAMNRCIDILHDNIRNELKFISHKHGTPPNEALQVWGEKFGCDTKIFNRSYCD